jgi:hypothetical protein
VLECGSSNDVGAQGVTSSKSKATIPAERPKVGVGHGRANIVGNSGTAMELDLRTCLEQLLATGQGNKVTEIMSWLRNSAVNTIEDRAKPAEKNQMGLLGVQKEFHRGLLSKTTESPLNSRKRNNLGYLTKSGNSSRMGLDASQQLPGLYELTRQDCEVNAPLNDTSRLLNGSELLTALDYTDDPFV